MRIERHAPHKRLITAGKSAPRQRSTGTGLPHVARKRGHHTGERKLPAIEKDHVRRAVIARQKREPVRRPEREQRVAVAQDVVSQGVMAEQIILELIINQLRRGIAIRVDFVENHLHLFLNFRLGKTRVEYEVAHQLDGAGKMLRQEHRIEDRLLLGRISVQLTAHRLHAIENVPRFAPPGPLEKQMLHEVGQSVLAFALVARTGMYRETGIRDLRRDKLVNHLQPVGQHICRIIGHNKNFYATNKRQKHDGEKRKAQRHSENREKGKKIPQKICTFVKMFHAKPARKHDLARTHAENPATRSNRHSQYPPR